MSELFKENETYKKVLLINSFNEEDFKFNEDFVEKVAISCIQNKYSSFALLSYYVKEPKDLELDASRANLNVESYLYKIFLKASLEAKQLVK